MATLTGSLPAILEDLIGVPPTGSAPRIKDIIKASSTATANPADFTAVASASAATKADATVTGVAVGDIVLGYGVVSGLATNQYVAGAYVAATDTVRVIIVNEINTSVTTTAVTMNFLIADVT